LALVLIPLAPLAAQAEEGEWYVSPSIAYTDDDPDRKIDDSFSGGQVQVGREMGKHLWLEGLFGYHDIDGLTSFRTACFPRTLSVGSVICGLMLALRISVDCRLPTRRPVMRRQRVVSG
jgi:hypothetical protein